MKDKKKTLLLLNPKAGKGKGNRYLPYILETLRSRIDKVDHMVSEYPEHLIKIAKNSLKEGYSRIITVGGDGTSYEVINGLYENEGYNDETEFGFIPAGTGNSFLRDFMEVKVNTVLKKILSFNPSKVDVAEFSYWFNQKKIKRYFINILGVGLISDILELTNEKFKSFGSAGYGLAVIVRLFRGMKNRLLLKVDGKEYDFKNSAMVLSNSRFTGGKMMIAPDADTGDGMLEIVVFDSVNRREILNIFSKVFSGKHVNHPKVKVLKGKDIELCTEPEERLMADGELLGFTPLTVTTHCKKVKVFL